MSFWVYILSCADRSYYIGHTDRLEERMAKHQRGEITSYTSSRLPVTLVYSQQFSSREEALASERQLKGWTRKKKEALIRQDWAELIRLARSSSSTQPIETPVRPSTGSGRTEWKQTMRPVGESL